MTSEKRAQKFHTDDASLPRSGYFFWLVESNFQCSTTNQKHYPDQGSDASSVCNFCACFSDVIFLAVVASPNVGCFLKLIQFVVAQWSKIPAHKYKIREHYLKTQLETPQIDQVYKVEMKVLLIKGLASSGQILIILLLLWFSVSILPQKATFNEDNVRVAKILVSLKRSEEKPC